MWLKAADVIFAVSFRDAIIELGSNAAEAGAIR
jgi:hypothetical protein